MARPKKEIDYDLVSKLAHIHCTQEEIADILGISSRTLQKDAEFLRVYKKGMNVGKMSLRRKQFDAINKGNVTMLIWLGKQLLGQRDDIDLNEIKKEELALKKEELRLKQAPPEKPDLDAYIEALNHDIKSVFADEK